MRWIQKCLYYPNLKTTQIEQEIELEIKNSKTDNPTWSFEIFGQPNFDFKQNILSGQRE